MGEKKVLVIRFSSFGDIVLTLPAILFLKKNNYKIDYLTKEKYSKLVSVLFPVENIFTISNHATFEELKNITQKLLQNNYYKTYDLHNNLRSKFIRTKFLIKSYVKKYRFNELLLFILKKKIYNFLKLRSLNRINENLKTVGSSGNNLELQIINRNKIKQICISSESLWKTKEWSFENFLMLSNQLIKENYKIIWVGLKKIEESKLTANVINKTGETTIEELVQILKESVLTISNDSGVMHLSEAVGTPVVGIFGPTTSEIGFAPRMHLSKIVETNLWCRPCSKTGRWCFRIFNKQKCLSDITVESVYKQSKNLLDTLK